MGLWAGVDIDPALGHRQADQPARWPNAVCWSRTPTGSTLRFAPPLVITAEEIDWAVDQFADVLAGTGSHLIRTESPHSGGTMPAPSIGLTEQMLRRRPVIGAPVAHGASDHLKRSIGTFQLTMFGVGATVGTGIFFVLSAAVPEAGPAVIVSFIIAGVAAGLSAICYAEMASAVPVSGSTYSYAYTTLGEFVAMGVAACLLLEYGVSISAVAVGWSGYLNKLLDNLFGCQDPAGSERRTVGRPTPGMVNLPAVVADRHVRAAADPRRQRVGHGQHRHGGHQARRAGDVRRHRADRVQRRPLRRASGTKGFAGITAAAGTIFFSFIGLDAVSTAGDEVKDPQKTMPRAIIAALIVVTTVYVLVAFAGSGHPAADEFGSEEQAEAGLSVILENITGGTVGQHDSGCRRGDLDLLGHAGGDVRPDPHPVRDGPRRPASRRCSPRSTRAP